MKNKYRGEVPATYDDMTQNSMTVEIQKLLDDLQNGEMSATQIRAILFNKMLDVYQVPDEHFLRNMSTPKRLDDPTLIMQLEELGFTKKRAYQLH